MLLRLGRILVDGAWLGQERRRIYGVIGVKSMFLHCSTTCFLGEDNFRLWFKVSLLNFLLSSQLWSLERKRTLIEEAAFSQASFSWGAAFSLETAEVIHFSFVYVLEADYYLLNDFFSFDLRRLKIVLDTLRRLLRVISFYELNSMFGFSLGTPNRTIQHWSLVHVYFSNQGWISIDTAERWFSIGPVQGSLPLLHNLPPSLFYIVTHLASSVPMWRG